MLTCGCGSLRCTAPTAPEKAWGDNTGSITITPPAGTQAGTTTEYKVYRVFDANPASTGTSVSYKLLDGKTTVPDVSQHMPTGETYNAATTPHFILDSQNQVYYGTESNTQSSGSVQITKSDNTTVYVTSVTGELSQAAIDAIYDYAVKDSTFQPSDYPLTASVTQSSSSSVDSATVTNVPYGYYYVTTTTGSVVSVGTVDPNPKIEDKNSVPTVDKVITTVTPSNTTPANKGDSKDTDEGSVTTDGKDAIAQVGSKVWYTSTVTFGKGSKNVKFHDSMSDGLSYNNDTTVSLVRTSSAGDQSETVTDATATYYTIKTTPDTKDTITITFEDGLDKTLATDDKPVVKAVITYSATVTSDALSVDSAHNVAKVTYGDNNSSTQESRTDVYNAKIVVTKFNGSHDALAGAGFKLSRTVNNQIQYYKYTAATASASAKVEWVSDTAEATELKTISGQGGNVLTFQGLPDGTYTLIETTTPNGYNTAANVTITVKGVSDVNKQAAEATAGALNKTGEGTNATIENLNKSETVVNNMGSALPHTGGPGTVWMYAIGGVLVVAAAVGLIARRRMGQH